MKLFNWINIIFVKTREIFESTKGRMSSTRVFSFCILLYFMYFNNNYIKTHVIDYNFILLDVVFLVAIFTPNYLHKKIEVFKDIK